MTPHFFLASGLSPLSPRSFSKLLPKPSPVEEGEAGTWAPLAGPRVHEAWHLLCPAGLGSACGTRGSPRAEQLGCWRCIHSWPRLVSEGTSPVLPLCCPSPSSCPGGSFSSSLNPYCPSPLLPSLGTEVALEALLGAKEQDRKGQDPRAENWGGGLCPAGAKQMSLCENTGAICGMRGLDPAGAPSILVPSLASASALLPSAHDPPSSFCPPCCPVPFSCLHLICPAPSFPSLCLKSVTWERPWKGWGERSRDRELGHRKILSGGRVGVRR